MRLFLLIFFLLNSCLFVQAERPTTELATDWRFSKKDVEVMAQTDAWETVSVPHTWNALDGEAGGGPIMDENQNLAETAEAASQRKAKIQKAEWKGKKQVFLRFEAASLVAKTYVNKTLLGEHRGTFTAFCYELTRYLNYGKTNEGGFTTNLPIA